MTPKRMVVARDPQGFRPLCIGKIKNSYVFASETCALDSIGAEYIRDVEPGEVVVVDENGLSSYRDRCGQPTATCIFEYIYFARPDSMIDGGSVHAARLNAGKYLAQESPVDADVVIGVPDSGIDAALGYARESKIPYGVGFIKNRYIGRTFIKPTQEERELAVRLKLNPIKEAIKGKKIVLIDDSIVRGTTSKSLIDFVKESEPAEIHFLVGCPPVIAPCYYGVAMASKKELIAANYSVEEIRQQLDIDTLGYISLESLVKAIGMPKEDLCLGCLNECYPTELPDDIEAETYYKP